MKIIFRILGALLFLIVAFGGAAVIYLNLSFPKVGAAPDIKVEITPSRLERGDYLVHHVANCMACHTARDFSTYGMGPVSDTSQAFTGGFEISNVLEDIPGQITTPNLTPLHLGSWSDGEIYRAISEGVSRDGRPLFPMMPYLHYRSADKEDLYSIIAYLRSLKAAGPERAANSLSFPFSLIARTIPQKEDPQPRPEPKDSLKYGAYLVNLAACFDCHTPFDSHHQPITSMMGAGGQSFIVHIQGLRVIIRPANITPDMATGIGSWDKGKFIKTMRERAKRVDSGEKVAAGGDNTIMPYAEFAGMTDQDLGAVYDYLRSLAPVSNSVIHFERLDKERGQ